MALRKRVHCAQPSIHQPLAIFVTRLPSYLDVEEWPRQRCWWPWENWHRQPRDHFHANLLLPAELDATVSKEAVGDLVETPRCGREPGAERVIVGAVDRHSGNSVETLEQGCAVAGGAAKGTHGGETAKGEGGFARWPGLSQALRRRGRLDALFHWPGRTKDVWRLWVAITEGTGDDAASRRSRPTGGRVLQRSHGAKTPCPGVVALSLGGRVWGWNPLNDLFRGW